MLPTIQHTLSRRGGRRRSRRGQRCQPDQALFFIAISIHNYLGDATPIGRRCRAGHLNRIDAAQELAHTPNLELALLALHGTHETLEQLIDVRLRTAGRQGDQAPVLGLDVAGGAFQGGGLVVLRGEHGGDGRETRAEDVGIGQCGGVGRGVEKLLFPGGGGVELLGAIFVAHGAQAVFDVFVLAREVGDFLAVELLVLELLPGEGYFAPGLGELGGSGAQAAVEFDETVLLLFEFILRDCCCLG